MKEISDTVRKKIHHFLLVLGLAMEDIAPLVGVAPSTVSKVAGELAAYMGQETYDLHRGDAVKRRKNKISMEAAIQGAEVIDAVGKHGIDKAKEYAVNVVVAAEGFGVPADKLASRLNDMVEIGKKYGIPAIDAPAFAEQKAKEFSKMKEEAGTFEEDLKSRKLNRLTLAMFDQTLKRLGVDGPQKLGKAARMTERLEAHDWSTDWVTDTLGSIVPPEKQLEKLKSDAKTLKPIVKGWGVTDALHRIIEDGTPGAEMKNNILNKILSDASACRTDPAQVASQIFLNYLCTKGIPTPGPVVRVMLPTMPAEPVVPERKKLGMTAKNAGVVQFGSGPTTSQSGSTTSGTAAGGPPPS